MGSKTIITSDTIEDKAFLNTPTFKVVHEDWKAGRIKKLCRDLNDTLERIGGLGLSSNQIKDNVRVFVVDWRHFPFYKGIKPKAFVNPEFTFKSENWKDAREGCLSVPASYSLVRRSTKVTLSFLNHVGKRQQITAEGLLANVFQHEIDHLDGILMTDREKQQEKKNEKEVVSSVRTDVADNILPQQ